MLRKIVVDAQSVAASVAEKFADGAAGVWRDVLHRRGIGRRGRHHDAVFHGAVIFQCLYDLGDRGTLLTDRDVNADHVAALLVDDGVERDGSLAGLTVTDDQLALSAADGDHGIDGLHAGLQRLLHRLPVNHAGRDGFDGIHTFALDRALTLDWLAQRVDHAPDQAFTHGDRHDASSATDLVALRDFLIFTEQHGAHLVLFEGQ